MNRKGALIAGFFIIFTMPINLVWAFFNGVSQGAFNRWMSWQTRQVEKNFKLPKQETTTPWVPPGFGDATPRRNQYGFPEA